MAATNFAEAFKGRYQDILTKTLVGMKIASTQLKSDLKFGDTVHRFILDVSGVRVRDITRYTDRTVDALSDSDETLVINKQKGLTFPIDSWDKLQAGPLQLAETAGERVAFKLKQYIDGDIFNEVTNAANTVDSGDIAGTAGNPIALSTSNAIQSFATLQAKARALNIEDNGNLSIVIDPYHASIIYQTIIGKELALSESTFKNGYSGNVLGWKIYVSNNLKCTNTLTVATQATANDTVTIAGVVFTFVTPIGVTAGNVLIGASATASRQNLIAAINGAAGAGTTYVEVSAANRAKLDAARISAVEASSTAIVTGYGRFTFAETLTAGADIWTANGAIVHCFAGKPGSIELVLQQEVGTELRDESKQKTTNVLVDALYGLKTFADGAATMIDFKLAF